MFLPWLTLHRNKKETLTQNYRRLGLVTKLGKPTGGSEPRRKSAPPTKHVDDHPFTVPNAANAAGAAREVLVERGPDGQIVRVLDGARANPLGDALNELDTDSESDGGGGGEAAGKDSLADQHWESWGGIRDDERPGGEEEAERPAVIRELERRAAYPAPKKTWTPSEREAEWLERLVARHGEDTEAMAWDRRLNPMQQTAKDIARRLRRWRETQ
jgi:nucleolar protein 16